MFSNMNRVYVVVRDMLSDGYARIREWLSPLPPVVKVAVVAGGLGVGYVLLVAVAKILFWMGVLAGIVAGALFCGYVISRTCRDKEDGI